MTRKLYCTRGCIQFMINRSGYEISFSEETHKKQFFCEDYKGQKPFFDKVVSSRSTG